MKIVLASATIASFAFFTTFHGIEEIGLNPCDPKIQVC